MNAPIPDEVWKQVARIVEQLAAGEFAELESAGTTGRTNPDDLRRVVDEYGRKLIPLPREARALAEVYDRPGSEILVNLPMWTVEEGESDLELQVSCHKDASESWICVIEDLLVP